MQSLFESMARHRPEWLAQGLLMRAITTEPCVRKLLLERLKWRQCPGFEEVPSVTEEEQTSSKWRADLCVAWAQSKAYLELKILAGFTVRQEEALKERRIDLVVLLRPDGRELPVGMPVVTWAEVAERATEVNLKLLLEQVTTSFDWRQEALPADVLEEEFAGFIAGAIEGRWPRMYRFLSTVHSHLRESAETETAYRASNAWSFARKSSEPYYGYCFWLGEQDVPLFWMGFWRSKETGEIVFGVSVPGRKGRSVLLEETLRFDAADLATRALSAARGHIQSER
ncbi:hypothetical protein MYSTI_04537 [Myxococcus stipitatus DSM 14675]|uniref:Uncharacterized protein n=1 Tax=Myxococcus stipitatus (strain DSM 14675 / JCM 12634 / Mx s8) TaxID=1278073 RepID=L7UH99_MYXSD|nr:hypothetical protein [Myxococcus stipitatus]AGC45829.1 hypothetical protein MYSTI_04537 [Myxococcus stipitatus DSM 14675]